MCGTFLRLLSNRANKNSCLGGKKDLLPPTNCAAKWLGYVLSLRNRTERGGSRESRLIYPSLISLVPGQNRLLVGNFLYIYVVAFSVTFAGLYYVASALSADLASERK